MGKPAFIYSFSAMLLAASVASAHGTTSKGEHLYEEYCASCHGINGNGEGPAGQNMTPPPANLLDALQNDKVISDEYLMWTIREGGRNVHTQMPSFEEQADISEEDATAIVRYLWEAFK